MQLPSLHILVVGATGSIGRHVTAVALAHGHSVTALCRSASKAAQLPSQVNTLVADVTEPASLRNRLPTVDAVIITLGSDGRGKIGARTVDYGGVRNLLLALPDQQTHITLMTAIGVTNREGSYNQRTEAHDWKRRAERLVRISGHPYTIVRPGWFDYHDQHQHQLQLRQGDQRQSGTPQDGVIARRQLAEVLVASLTEKAAIGKTFELVAVQGPQQTSLPPCLPP